MDYGWMALEAFASILLGENAACFFGDWGMAGKE